MCITVSCSNITLDPEVHTSPLLSLSAFILWVMGIYDCFLVPWPSCIPNTFWDEIQAHVRTSPSSSSFTFHGKQPQTHKPDWNKRTVLLVWLTNRMTRTSNALQLASISKSECRLNSLSKESWMSRMTSKFPQLPEKLKT